MLDKYKKRTSQKYFLGVFIFFISVFLGSLFSGHQANAVTNSGCTSAGGTPSSKYVGGTLTPYCNFNLSAVNEIKSYSNFNALSQCARMGQWNSVITTADASTPSKWLGTDTISVGYLVDSVDGLLPCNAIIKNALDMWGYSGNYEEALTDFGYSKVSVPNCTGQGSTQSCSGNTVTWVGPTDNGTMLRNFQTTIRARVYSGAAPTLEGRAELLYLRAQSHLEKSTACNASPYKKVSDLTAAEKTQYANNNTGTTSSSNPVGAKDYLIVRLVNGTTWQTENWVYKIPKDNWTKIIKLNEAPSGGSVEYTCVKIANDMAGYADRVAADAASMVAGGLDPSSKYAGIIVTPGGAAAIGGANGEASVDTTTSSCTIEGVGWILCPVLTFMGGIVDGAYNFVSGLLVVQPLLTTGDTEGTYQAWAIMRNIANIAFVIAFLIIIFSQLTGVALSNYGVKKLVPRLVVAAILVNVSFWVCAIAIDFSNIIGASIVTVFDSVGTNISTNLSGSINDGGNLLNGGQWTNIVGSIIAGGAVVGAVYYVGLSALIPALIAAVVAIVTVFLVLTLRQALIILLIVISPLAFVAYLLPNTEDLFTKWRKLFTTLLLMYPIIAGIFGASALASVIIMKSSPGNFVVQIMGATIAILPLALTPIVMKTAGGLLNRFGGMVNNSERGPIDRLKKAGAGYRETRNTLRNTRALSGGPGSNQGGRGAFVRWRSRRGAIDAGVKSQKARAEQQYIAGAMTNGDTDTPSTFAKKAAGGTNVYDKSTGSFSVTADPAALQRALAGAKFTIEKAEMDDVKAEQSLVANLTLPQLQQKLYEANISPARSAAVIDRMIKIGGPDDYDAMVDAYGNDQQPKNTVVRQTIAHSLRENGPKFLKASDLDNISTGNLTTTNPDGTVETKTLQSIAQNNVGQAVYSQEKLADESIVNLQYAFVSADQKGKQSMIDTAAYLKVNETLKGKIKHNKSAIDNLSITLEPTAKPPSTP